DEHEFAVGRNEAEVAGAQVTFAAATFTVVIGELRAEGIVCRRGPVAVRHLRAGDPHFADAARRQLDAAVGVDDAQLRYANRFAAAGQLDGVGTRARLRAAGLQCGACQRVDRRRRFRRLARDDQRGFGHAVARRDRVAAEAV